MTQVIEIEGGSRGESGNRDSGAPFISVRGLSKSFDKRFVLQRVSLEIPEGCRLGVVGGIGSGKTTLIHSIARIRGYEPTEGSIVFRVTECVRCGRVGLPSVSECSACGGTVRQREVDIWNGPNADLLARIRSRIGIVFQRSFAVYGNCSALENVIETINQTGGNQETRYETAAKILESVNLMHRSSHLARDLSGGEKQRLTLARQLAKDPIVLLADDPTGALDMENAEQMCRVLESSANGRVTIASSHLPRVIEMLSERAVLLDAGTIRASGPSKNIVDEFMDKGLAPPVPRRPVEERGMIRLKKISKVYHKASSGVVKALSGVDLDVSKGSILGIVGKSGAGKTTLTKILAGLIQATSGEACMRVGDEWVSMREPGELGRGRATRYISTLYQDYSLYSGMTVFENLSKSDSSDMPDEFLRVKVVHILRRIGFPEEGMRELFGQYPDQLSEGERHRIALARAMVRDPLVLILDEPSNTMDPLMKVQVSDALRNLANEFGTTVLIVSHDEGFAARTCDYIVRIDKGRIVGGAAGGGRIRSGASVVGSGS